MGYGTWRISNEEVAEAVLTAIEAGYRHIDTAAYYKNECGIGQAIKQSDINRKEIFITSKLWNSDRGYNKTFAAFEQTLNNLQLDYLDLYLIHWPANSKQFKNWDEINTETWLAFIELYKQGKVKAIGLSNFMPHHLQSLTKTEIMPAVNQIEYHPGLTQQKTVDFCKANNILIEAWGPLGKGKMLSNETLQSIAQKYGKSVSQLCIKWCLQNGVLPLPKSTTPVRIKKNTEVFDFTISEKDMQTINNMEYFGGSGLNPDEIEF